MNEQTGCSTRKSGDHDDVRQLSLKEAARIVEEAGAIVQGMIVIYSHLLPKAEENLSSLRFPVHLMCDFKSMLEAGISRSQFFDEDLRLLMDWHEDPEAWSRWMKRKKKP